MKYYDLLARYERDGFDVIVDKTWEDLSVKDCFDDTQFDIAEICHNIDHGNLDWFMLRVRVMLDGYEMGSHYLGGCLYEDAREVLTDGTAEDCIGEALHEAKKAVYPLMRKLQAINEDIEREGVAV